MTGRTQLSFAVGGAALLLGVTALATGGAVARTSSPAKASPRTLLTEKGRIYAFAQDGEAIGWIAADGRVRVRRVSTGKTWIVGKVRWAARANSAVVALAGTRALWAWDNGGNNNETAFGAGAPGRAPTSVGRLNGGFRGFGDGERISGIAGDDSTLAIGWADEECTGQPFGCEPCDPRGSCPLLYVVGGGVALAPARPSGQRPPPIAGVTPPALCAIAQGRIAVVPALSPTPEAVSGIPRVGEDRPVEVFDLRGHLLMRVQPVGIVKDVALASHELTVLLRSPDGSKAVLRYDARNGRYLGRSRDLTLGAIDLASGTGGDIFRVGRRIYVLHGQRPRLITRAAGTPIGLSIEGRRIAWAENVGGHGRIRALTLGS